MRCDPSPYQTVKGGSYDQRRGSDRYPAGHLKRQLLAKFGEASLAPCVRGANLSLHEQHDVNEAVVIEVGEPLEVLNEERQSECYVTNVALSADFPYSWDRHDP